MAGAGAVDAFNLHLRQLCRFQKIILLQKQRFFPSPWRDVTSFHLIQPPAAL
jgi:hypothetical protein